MKIVIALDKFKGSLSAAEACAIVRRALTKLVPGTELVCKPMADGGEGTAAALQTSLGGVWIRQRVTGPLPGHRRTAKYLWLRNQKLAVVEMAEASGLVWLKPTQRNPLCTTTNGTGELLADAMDRGANEIWLTVGGSATVDGGVGAAMALGWKFLDSRGRNVALGGAGLKAIAKIVPPVGFPRRFPKLRVLCDVDNPLCGIKGAARVFGPQKGATPAIVKRLEAGLENLATVVKAQLGRKIGGLPGGGAAGGLAAGAAAFMNARLAPGAETVMRISGLDAELTGADWVITGEGSFDEQSLRGKVVAGVTKLARKSKVKVAVLAGRVKLPRTVWRRAGVSIALPIAPDEIKTPRAMRAGKTLLFAAAQKLGRELTATGRGTKG